MPPGVTEDAMQDGVRVRGEPRVGVVSEDMRVRRAKNRVQRLDRALLARAEKQEEHVGRLRLGVGLTPAQPADVVARTRKDT